MLFQIFIGVIVLTGFCLLISEDRKSVRLRTVLTGLALQLVLAILMLKLPFVKNFFMLLNSLVLALEEATGAGTSLVLGYLGGGTLPFEEKYPGSSFILAFRALPLVLVVSALSSLLFYLKLLPVIVRGFSKLLQKTMDIGGAVGLSAAANVFLGMIESPLLIRPYLKNLTRSELFTVMTCGMTSIAGTVMVLYAGLLKDVIPDIMGHILTASIISAPAAITISMVLIPERDSSTTGDSLPPTNAANSMDAVTKGTLEGVNLYIWKGNKGTG